jgi:hypothetical protein
MAYEIDIQMAKGLPVLTRPCTALPQPVHILRKVLSAIHTAFSLEELGF